MRYMTLTVCLGLAFGTVVPRADAQVSAGFVSLFNGHDLSGWIVPEGDNGHWKVIDGVIDYDARSESPENRNLWSQKEYKDFALLVDWRIKATPFMNTNARIVLPDGTDKVDENGKPIRISVPDSDSGIFLRGTGKAQVNIWCWPVGSGELWGYRMDRNMPPEVRAAATPKQLADANIGEWNRFEITVKSNSVSVVLNGKKVIDNAKLPGLPEKGRIALQHHGDFKDGKYIGPPSLVQFRNIYIKEL